MPSGVSTDSGWNWTPSAGSSRWRMAITTPPPWAVASRLVGQVGVHDQRVIARDGQRARQAGEEVLAVVGDLGRLAVHGMWRTTRPPNACPSDWWPRQTPSVLTPASGKRRMTSTEMPASLGVHGPGETTTRS